MRVCLLALPFLLAACTEAAPDTAPAPGAPGGEGQVAEVPPLDPGPPDPRTTVVAGSTGVVTPSGEVLAGARRIRVSGIRERVPVVGPGPHRLLIALQAGQRLSVEAAGGPTVSVFDPGGKPLAQDERAWSATVDQTADFIIEANGSGAIFVEVE